MKLTEINYKIKCDMAGCRDLAKYAIRTGGIFTYDLNICRECVTALYKTLGEVLVPKSPVNMLNTKGVKRGQKHA